MTNVSGETSYPIEQSLKALKIAQRLSTKQWLTGIDHFFWKRLDHNFEFTYAVSFGCN